MNQPLKLGRCGHCGRPMRMDARVYLHGTEHFHWECTEPPAQIDVRRLEFKPGDTLVLHSPTTLSSRVAEQVRQIVKISTGIDKLLIVDGDIKVSVLSVGKSDGEPI